MERRLSRGRRQIRQASENAEVLDSASPGATAADISLRDLIDKLVAAYGEDGTSGQKTAFADALKQRLHQIARKHECAVRYNIIVLFDNSIMIKGDSDRMYEAISRLRSNSKPLLLVLLSNGGEPGSAYLIGKLCRESSNGTLSIAIPRHAKSAATLLACAADRIHMGSLSELGPIDLQINRMPALGLKHSIEHIAELVTRFPDSAIMFARYLKDSVQPIQIGYYERAAKSVEQYAERLLEDHKDELSSTPQAIAHKLVYEYKDHGFVIDKGEAERIFGKQVVQSETPEYVFSNELYRELSTVERFADRLGYGFYFIGGLDAEAQLPKLK